MKAKTYKRPIVLSFCRGNQVHAMRHYARLATAIPRAVSILMEQGQPKDVIDVASAEFGFQIGTVKIHAGGKLDVRFDPGLVKP